MYYSSIIFNLLKKKLHILEKFAHLLVPAPRGAGRAMRIQLLAVSVKHSGLRQAAGPRTRST